MRKIALLALVVLISTPVFAWKAKAKKGETFAEAYARMSAEVGAVKKERDRKKALLQLGKWAGERHMWVEADAAYAKAVDIDPDCAEAREKLGFVRAGKEWLPAAEADAREREENRSKGRVRWDGKYIDEKRMVALRKKERVSVGWDFDRKFTAGRITVYSKVDEETTRRLERLAAGLLRSFGVEWGKHLPNKAKHRIKVYVAADASDYKAIYLKRRGGKEPDAECAGFYDWGLKEAFFHLSKYGVRTLLGDFAHECTHALQDGIIPNIDMLAGKEFWFAEGWAQYSDYSIEADDRLRYGSLEGAVHCIARLRERVADNKLNSLETVITMNKETFESGDAILHYAQAWALFYFLSHYEDEKYRKRFMVYLPAACRVKGGLALFRKAFGDLRALEKEYTGFIESLVKKPGKDETDGSR